MKLGNGLKAYTFAEWLHTNIGSQDYDYLTISSSEGGLYFLLKNEKESRLIRVDKKTQDEKTTEDIAVLIRSGKELKQPHIIEIGAGHKILFENGRMIVS